MKSLFGATLIGCGILIAGASGLCLLLLAGSLLADPTSLASREQMTYLPAFLIAAGIPLAIGIGLFYAGRALVRQADADARDSASGPEADRD